MNGPVLKTKFKLLPSDPKTREIAYELYELVAGLPIIAPHGHVDPTLLLENKPFSNPAALFVYFDHYVTRILHTAGFSLEDLGKSKCPNPNEVWRLLCSNWHLYLGTASGYWMTHVLETVFGIEEAPSLHNADELYELISDTLQRPEMRPRELLTRFNIQVLATTDDPCDDLATHQALRDDVTFTGNVVPTFRPDAYLDPRNLNFVANVKKLLALCGAKQFDYADYIYALRERRSFFIKNGAFSADHGVLEPYTVELPRDQAERLFLEALSERLSASDAREFAGHMLFEMAKMSSEDGLVMTIHAGVHRNHSSFTFDSFGPDTGNDIPVQVEFVNNLHPVLEKFGLNPNFKVVLFSIDESNWGREMAPLAGFYPSVFIGAPWWFLDAPDAARRYREAITETAGFYKTSGFIDDTRAFLSIPARHDMSRRVDSGYLARLVVEERLTLTQAKKIAVDLVVAVPKRAFNL